MKAFGQTGKVMRGYDGKLRFFAKENPRWRVWDRSQFGTGAAMRRLRAKARKLNKTMSKKRAVSAWTQFFHSLSGAENAN